MSKRKTCAVQGCCEDRCRYSTRNMCERHDMEADEQERAEWLESDQCKALDALDEASTLEEVKDVVRHHLIEALLQ